LNGFIAFVSGKVYLNVKISIKEFSFLQLNLLLGKVQYRKVIKCIQNLAGLLDYLGVWGLLGYLVVFPSTHTSSTFLIKPLESAVLFKALTALYYFTISLKI
jgi:hypothetical protein